MAVCVTGRACVDNQCARLADGDAAGRDFRLGNRRVLQLRRPGWPLFQVTLVPDFLGSVYRICPSVTAATPRRMSSELGG